MKFPINFLGVSEETDDYLSKVIKSIIREDVKENKAFYLTPNQIKQMKEATEFVSVNDTQEK